MSRAKRIAAYILNFLFPGSGFVVLFGLSGTIVFLAYFVGCGALIFLSATSGSTSSFLFRFGITGCVLLIGLSYIHLYLALNAAAQTEGSIIDYFENALEVYAKAGHIEAKIAAIAAGKSATYDQRMTMIDFIDILKSKWESFMIDEPQARPIMARIDEIREAIYRKEWTPMEISQEKDVLMKYNPEYVDALDEGDPDIFIRDFPEIFKK